MNYKSNYSNREQRKMQAEEHYHRVARLYGDQISECVYLTTRYSSESVFTRRARNEPMVIELHDKTTVEAIRMCAKYPNVGKLAALNFASYTNPGGKFLEGSRAQEESLCHESFLYNVLFCSEYHYVKNRRERNHGLYTNTALYSPNVIFMGTTSDINTDKYRQYDNIDEVKCDIITCAAPNRRLAVDCNGVPNTENIYACFSRIKFILDIAVANKVDTLILGAFGCGVFEQSPDLIAGIFNKYLKGVEGVPGIYSDKFKKVIFAVPSDNHKNFKNFSVYFNQPNTI